MLRDEFDKATEFDVECMALEEYLRRFTTLILTVNGLGSVGGWGDEAEPADQLLLAFHAGAPARGLARGAGRAQLLSRAACAGAAPVAETSPR